MAMKRDLNSSISKSLLLFVVLLTVGSFLRLWHLGSLPEIMHRDEVAIGYNSFSLAETGKDEHGQSFPMNFKSFGDYKLPGMIYTVLVSIKIFGLNAAAVRLPTTLASVLSLISIYWLSREMGWSKRISFIAMLFLTFSFFHISQARNAYEPMVGLFLSITSWASWLAGNRNWRWYLIALLFYFIGSLFYNLPFLLLPMLFVISWMITNPSISSRKLLTMARKIWPIAGLVVLVVGLSLLFQSSNVGKSNITIFKSDEIVKMAENSVHATLVGGVPSRIARLVNSVSLFSVVQFFKGYFEVFNPVYIFFTGDANLWHNLRSIGLGNHNPVLIIPFLMGIYVLIKNGAKKQVKLLAMYLGLSPIISALTINSPVTNRLMDFNTAVVLVAAVGTSEIIVKYWRSNQIFNRLLIISIVTLYCGFFFLFGLRYYFSYNQLMPREWNPGLNEMIGLVRENQSKYDWIYITPDLDLGYIHLAFHLPFDPADFQQSAQWYTNGFELVGEYRQFRFDHFVDYSYLSTRNVAKIFDDTHKTILVVQKGEPKVKTNLLWQDQDWGGRWRWYAWETDLNKAVQWLEATASTPDQIKTLQYLYSCQTGSCDNLLLESDPIAVIN